MLQTKNQRSSVQLTYAFAFAATLGSFALWTCIVTQHVANQYYSQANSAAVLHEDLQSNVAVLHDSTLDFVIDPPTTPHQNALEEAAKTVEEIQHAAPAEEVNVEEQPTVESASQFAGSVLHQWELQQAYTISIPAIGVQAPVYLPSKKHWDTRQWDMLENQMQTGLNVGAVAYPHSVSAGRNGSLIIAGHSSPPNAEAAKSKFGNLFEKLPDLGKGGVISILYDNGFVDYEVVDTKIVTPQETSILSQDYSESTLKLITCFPIGTTKDRLIVIAKRKVAS